VLALAVLSMLSEEPMHAYRMQQLIKERHKDDVVNVSQRNSVYQTIQRLLRDELIAIESTQRTENRPERTTYRLTAAGRDALAQWLHAMLAVPTREYPEFPAALSFLPSVSPGQAVSALTTRIGHLESRLAVIATELAEAGAFLPRLFLIESEYEQQVVTAELGYVRALVDDLAGGRITWPFPPVPLS
jgi:DNA-binding PadR family transcriptional regulator